MNKKSGCAVATMLVCGIAFPVWADDEGDVAAAMDAWADYLAKGSTEDPGEILTLYAEDGVLWGTLSSTRRDDPAAIHDYFVAAYKALPARYSFTLVKRDGEWQIVDHHSSAMPPPPK